MSLAWAHASGGIAVIKIMKGSGGMNPNAMEGNMTWKPRIASALLTLAALASLALASGAAHSRLAHFTNWFS